MNPTTKKERDGVPIRVYKEPNGVTVGTYDYGTGDGLTVSLDYDALEAPKEAIEEDLQVLFDEAFERALDEVMGE